MKGQLTIATALLCLGIFWAAGPAGAQTPPDNVFTLGEILVEDASAGQDIAISNTITAEEIRDLGAVSAAEALEYIPGITLVTTAKGESNINIQGFGQKDVLVLIDGVPYYETQNGPLDLQQIPASIIGKIEVTKGASSVLYGPNALGGVVNIITKKGVEGFSGTVEAEGGMGSYGRGAATLNYGATNGFSILGTMDYRTRDTLYFSDDYTPRATDIRYRGRSDGRPIPRVVDQGDKKDNSDLDSLSLWTRLGYTPTKDTELYLSLYRFDMERGRPFSDLHNKVFNFSDGYSSFGHYDMYRDTGADLAGKFSVNQWWDLRAMAFYHSHEDDYTSYLSEEMTSKISTSTWDDDAFGFSLFSDMELGQYHKLSLTAQYRDDKHKQKDSAGSDWENSESNTLTLGVEDTISFGQFKTVLGLAFHDFDAEKIGDLDGYTHDTLDPMAGLSWTSQNGLELFGAVAKKTRFPTFGDMEDSGTIYRLSPEENINYTLGARKLFFNRSQVKLSGFYNDISDRIGENSNREPANIDEAVTYGIELETKTDITDRFSFGLDYVYTHARNESEDRTSDFLEDIPEYTVTASATYMIPKIETRAILRATYKDSVIFNTETNEKEYAKLVNFSLVKDWDNGFSLGGHITNLFDEDYYEGKGMACDGFNFKLVARYEF